MDVGHLAIADHALEDVEPVLRIGGANLRGEPAFLGEADGAAVGQGPGALQARKHVPADGLCLVTIVRGACLDGFRAVDRTHGIALSGSGDPGQ